MEEKITNEGILMFKRIIGLLAVLTFTGWAGMANAVPIQWNFVPGNLTGFFNFDANIDIYSSVSITESNFSDTYSSATGDELNLHAVSDGFADVTDLVFLAPLTNTGGVINFTGSTECFSICGEGPNPFEFEGTVVAQVSGVPTPATLALFGLGLAGLGFFRRKKA